MDSYDEKDQNSWTYCSISALEEVQSGEFSYYHTISRIEFPTRTLFDTRKENALWTNTGSSLLVIPDVIFDLLKSAYEFRGSAQVEEFLNKSSFLVSLLIEAKVILNHFYEDSIMFLEVFKDPEFPSDQQLVIYVHTDIEVKQASDRLDLFFDFWWAENLSRANGLLCINLEFSE